MEACPLCQAQDEKFLWKDNRCRVILVADADYPAFCRVVWNKHVKEMTDLTKSQCAHFMDAVFAVEQAQRELLQPRKINLASFGNQVSHLHWHVIPRFEDDAHFPDPVWAPRKRAGNPHVMNRDQLVQALYRRLGGRLKRQK